MDDRELDQELDLDLSDLDLDLDLDNLDLDFENMDFAAFAGLTDDEPVDNNQPEAPKAGYTEAEDYDYTADFGEEYASEYDQAYSEDYAPEYGEQEYTEEEYAQAYDEQPYAQEYDEQAYAQAYDEQAYAQDYDEQAYAQDYDEQAYAQYYEEQDYAQDFEGEYAPEFEPEQKPQRKPRRQRRSRQDRTQRMNESEQAEQEDWGEFDVPEEPEAQPARTARTERKPRQRRPGPETEKEIAPAPAPEFQEAPAQPQNPRRKPRNKARYFKEVYLPMIIVGVAAVMILVFIIGSIVRAVGRNNAAIDASIQASKDAASLSQQQDAEAQQILEEAEIMAAGYNYEGAIELIDNFSGDITNYPELTTMRSSCVTAANQLIAWTDPGAIPNLSFHVLMADLPRCLADDEYGGQYNRNFVTVGEFSKILDQLYANGYVLVNLDSFTEKEVAEDGTVTFIKETIYLPEGKKPIMITETNVNYYRYMVDSDNDGLADAGGAGFASRMVVENGKVITEMVDTSGNTIRGAYDLVPILDAFIEEHPDFSYHGAKAIIAVTGYDGLFGYRTNNTASATYAADVDAAASVARTLRKNGYQIACYTYSNIKYGEKNATEIQADLRNWTNEVTPILGEVDILVYALNSDLDDAAYSTSKLDVMIDAGFHYFLGFGNNPWAAVSTNYVRQDRILVTGTNMAHYPNNYSKYFDSSTVLDPQRGNVPKG